jgi:DNA uptake protein ComE-like DNA-binding protein
VTQVPDDQPLERESGPRHAGDHAVHWAPPGRPRWWSRDRAWLLLVGPAGLTTWAAFLYIGIRARRRQWLGFAALYAAMVAAWLLLDAPAHPSGAAAGTAAGLALATWVGGGIHAIAISGDAIRQIKNREDPALDAARRHIQRRAEGRKLLATQPQLARELGIGRPDLPGSDDYGLIDVNHAPAQMLTRLPGVSPELAGQIVSSRGPQGGFSSVEDLGLVLSLPPGLIDNCRELAIFPPL